VSLQHFIVDQMGNHAKSFLKGLQDTPEDLFNLEPPAGGHSVAWHALHILDWNRILVPPNMQSVTGQTFAYLGWEDKDWAKGVLGPSLASVTDGKTRILEVVALDFERGLRDVAAATDAQLEAKVVTPTGERPIVGMLTGQIRHVPYHWGQLKMTASQLERARL
jgi:DinB superfamily